MVMQKTAPHATQPQMEEYRAAFFGGVAYFFGLIEHQFSDDDRTEAEERISSVLVHVRDELMGMAGKYMKTGEGSKT
jgi:hypothetical protein